MQYMRWPLKKGTAKASNIFLVDKLVSKILLILRVCADVAFRFSTVSIFNRRRAQQENLSNPVLWFLQGTCLSSKIFS